MSDRPNQNEGLTPAQLKAKFDESGNRLKSYINNTLIAELQSSASGYSGAQRIGYDGASVDNIADALDQIYSAGSGTIPPDGTVSQEKLDPVLNSFVEGFSVNSLAYAYTNFKDQLPPSEIAAIEADLGLMGIIESNPLFYLDSIGDVLQTFATPGTYTFIVPAGVKAVRALVIGGGGGGGGYSESVGGVGGSGIVVLRYY